MDSKELVQSACSNASKENLPPPLMDQELQGTLHRLNEGVRYMLEHLINGCVPKNGDNRNPTYEGPAARYRS